MWKNIFSQTKLTVPLHLYQREHQRFCWWSSITCQFNCSGASLGPSDPKLKTHFSFNLTKYSQKNASLVAALKLLQMR